MSGTQSMYGELIPQDLHSNLDGNFFLQMLHAVPIMPNTETQLSDGQGTDI